MGGEDCFIFLRKKKAVFSKRICMLHTDKIQSQSLFFGEKMFSKKGVLMKKIPEALPSRLSIWQ